MVYRIWTALLDLALTGLLGTRAVAGAVAGAVAKAIAKAEKIFTLTATDCDLRMNLSTTCKDLFSTTVSKSSQMDKCFANICVFTFSKS